MGDKYFLLLSLFEFVFYLNKINEYISKLESFTIDEIFHITTLLQWH